MRHARRLTIGLLLAVASHVPVLAVEPDDTPWDLRGTDATGQPKTIDDLLARDQLSIIEDTDITPPGQDQRDLLDNHDGARFQDDRLTPKLPQEVHDAPARAPETALKPVETAPHAAAVAIRRPDTVQPAAPPATAVQSRSPAVQPAPTQGFKPEPVAPMTAPPRRTVTPIAPQIGPPSTSTVAEPAPSTRPPQATAPGRMQPTQATPAAGPAPATAAAPTSEQPAASGPAQSAPVQNAQTAPVARPAPAAANATAQSTPAANGPNASAPSTASPPTPPAASPALALPSPTPPALTTPPPAQSTVAAEGYDPHATPPAAVPSTPVTTPSVAVNGKLYLPLRRYFETKAAVTLGEFDMGDRTALAEFYEKTVGEAMWVTKEGLNEAARSMIEEIKKADDWGLASADYKIPNLVGIGGGSFDYQDLTDVEVKLSLVAMEYARHARGDRIFNPPEQLSSYIDRKPQLIERPKLLEALAAASDKAAFLRGLHPKHAQFERLRDLLLDVRAAQTSGSEPEPIPDGPKITQGKSHWQVALVRRRLKFTEPAQKRDGTPASDEYYDEALAQAVIAYKEKNEISPANATITGELRKSLNQTTRLSEELILANMEAWRWMPEDLGETYVWVNLPEFLVRVKKNNQIIHEERVITGRMETQTPIFSNKMRTIVFQPSWNVPESIKVNELLPKLRSGNNPIEGQGLRMERNGRIVDAWDVDWNQQDIRNYHIYQPPGDANVLGIVKFLFPNKHSVYLHDTPTKRLFNEKIRTFSHGCMRVRNPVRLAEVIMAEDKGWDTDKVNELITTGPEDNDIALDKPMPVHVTYFTLWVDDSGEPKIFGDVYGHEKRIVLGLHGRWGEIDKGPDHLAPADPDQIASSREDWGDEDGEAAGNKKRRSKVIRYGFDDEPAQEGYKQVAPKKKNGSVISDLFKNIFGNN